MASNVWGVRTNAEALVVVFASGVSDSTLLRIFWRASIVAEGGVFSPRIGLFKWLGVPLAVGVGVSDPDWVGVFSGDLFRYSSYSDSLDVRSPFSGDLLSSESLRPLTLLLP
jgi:hypothetical protein